MIWNEHPTTIQGLPDLLLAHALVDDGVLLQRDGSLLAAWEYRGPDFIAATPEEIWAHSERLNHALRLGTGWMIQCDVIRSEIREYLPHGAFPDPMSRLVDEERQQQFLANLARFESQYFLTLTYLPPLAQEQKVRGFCFDGATTDSSTRALDTFKTGVEAFEKLFGALFQIRRLKACGDNDDLVRFIRRCITGDDYPFNADFPMCLNDQLGVDFVPGLEPIVDGKHVRVMAIDGFPPFSRPGILAEVDRLPIEYRWHTRAIPLDGYEAQALWGKMERQWRGVTKRGLDIFRKTAKTRGDAWAVKMEDDAYAAQAEAVEGRVQTANYTSVLIVMDHARDRADESAKRLHKTIRNLGFGARMEDINAVEAWRGSLPGDGYRNVRRVMLHTLNLAHLLPTNSVWTGVRENPSALMPAGSPALLMAVTNGSTPFHFNLHVDDVGHTLVLGPTGSGKSTLLSMVAMSWLRYPGAQVFAFDRGYSIWPATMAAGEEFYDIAGSGAELCFAPLKHLATDGEAAWACGWIEGLCELNGLIFTPLHRNAVVTAIERLRSSKARTLTDFCATVQNMEVREALEHFTITGPLGSLLDAESDDLGAGRWIAFETEHLLNLDAKAIIPVLLYLFRRIEMRLDGSPTLILLDEAWSYLEHPLFQRQLRMWLRTMRKKNAVVVMATQQISDIASSEIADVVLENCPTKILLPNAEARNPGSREFYTRMGLNDGELEMLQAAIPKKHYYVVARVHRRLIDLACGPVALSVCGVNGRTARRSMQALIDQHPNEWRSEWLIQRGLPEWARRLEQVELEVILKEEGLCASA